MAKIMGQPKDAANHEKKPEDLGGAPTPDKLADMEAARIQEHVGKGDDAFAPASEPVDATSAPAPDPVRTTKAGRK